MCVYDAVRPAPGWMAATYELLWSDVVPEPGAVSIWNRTGKDPDAPAPMFVVVEVSATGVPAVAKVGVIVAEVRSGGGAATVTVVHPLQLFASFDSLMDVAHEALLSAQARTLYVPLDAKV